MNELLVIFEEFQIYTPEIAANIDKKTIDAYVLQAARFDLRQLLGDKFYTDVIINQLLPDYASLINGQSIYDGKLYYGIKPYICYMAYIYAIRESYAKLTPSGIVKKVLDYSEPVKSGDLKSQIDYFAQKAEIYARGVLDYAAYQKRENNIFNLFNICANAHDNMPKTQIIQVVKGKDKYPPSGGAGRYENSY